MICPFVWEMSCRDAWHCKVICPAALSLLEGFAEEARELQEEVELMERADGCYYDRDF